MLKACSDTFGCSLISTFPTHFKVSIPRFDQASVRGNESASQPQIIHNIDPASKWTQLSSEICSSVQHTYMTIEIIWIYHWLV